VRHGESEGNYAQEFSKGGDDSLWRSNPEFQKKHNSCYRLTSLGQEQSRVTGAWLKNNVSERFDYYYCSEYIRALETASLLGFTGSRWTPDIFLREQDKGILEGQSDLHKREQFEEEVRRQSRQEIYYASPGGESIAQCGQRIELWLEELNKYCSGLRVLVVCHGDIMKAMRLRIERLKQAEWLCFSTDADYKSWNCSVVHFSRRNPITGDIHSRLCYVRSVCPWDLSRASGVWKYFSWKGMTEAQLTETVNLIPRILDDPTRIADKIKNHGEKDTNPVQFRGDKKRDQISFNPNERNS